MSTRIPNPTDDTPVSAPQRPEGGYYDLELIYDAGRWRAYGDTPAELLELLLPGYQQQDAQQQYQARIRAAVDVQVALQAQLNSANPELVTRCTDEQRAILVGDRDRPPAPEAWTAPMPLVLVTSFYEPDGELGRPTAAGDAIIWLDPSNDWSLLESLHRAGWIHLARRAPSAPDTDI
ncbi:hypothetical protein OHA25_60385 (plasmid) [Nonomuraea sp. NBC_00507]|uniref:hypothetical protein n=1 Tax=Nonomuraea sp. NBC_00507 TaxID=2976002 RepID=UPI002E16D3E8